MTRTTQMSRYVPHASGVLALFLLSHSIDGQEAASTAYEGNCDSVSGNARSDEGVCVGFEFNDGANAISAGLATTSKWDFNGSSWSFSEGVSLSFGTTDIQASEAVLRFEAGELVHGELSGSPVVMSDYIEERGTPIRGTAGRISYDKEGGTVRLNGQATLVIGENEVMGCDWVYNFIEKNYSGGGSEDCSGVLFRLAPPEDGNDPQDQDESP